MTTTRPQNYLRQLLLALVLFMVGQFALALHNHDLNFQTVDAEECVICLVATADDPVAVFTTPVLNDTAHTIQPLSALTLLAPQPWQSPQQPRAPPCS